MGEVTNEGMSLRDYFAAHMQEDDRLVKCIRAMDDRALEWFALHPGIEREEHITEVEFTNWSELGGEVQKVARILELEARAIARVRYMQADAMLAAREGK
jgi:diadenosine tetraphosphate (Ap4A) HIT family hydrolase